MENRRTTHVVKSKFQKFFEDFDDDDDDVFRSSRTQYDDVFRNMGNPPTPEGKDAFPKKFDDYEEGYTFLSIGGKLPQIRALLSDGDLEAEDCCGDSSTIAPEVAKPKEASAAAGKEAVDSSAKEDDSIRSKAEFTEEEQRILKKEEQRILKQSYSDDEDGSYSTKEEQEQMMIKKFLCHLNAVGPYDIEMAPPKCLNYPLIPLSLDFLEIFKKHDPESYDQLFLGPAKFALQQINVKENRNYEFDGIVKFVNTPLQQVYVTIAGKEEICTKTDMQSGGTYEKATFQASVYTPYGYNNFKYELLEWKRKPDPPAAAS